MKVLLALLACAALPCATAEAKISARGSVEQVQVTGAHKGARVTLTRNGQRVARQKAGPLGGAIFRGVKPGSGYRVNGGKRLEVMPDRSAPPSTKLYKQKIPASGYGYLTTRDGTKLAIDVHLPSGSGPYPTLVEYSGYGMANPDGAESSIGPIATLLGFAVVDVNMRGTGCSGGAFDYFEALQGLDGYDAIETVARQPWVLGGKVGMVGVSYPGISQLFVARTRPPHLAAITPLSVIDDTATTLYPGGILNTGFALSWGKDRVHDAKPASKTGGQPWALKRIKGGDKLCRANQALHAQAPDLLKKLHQNRYYVPKVADPLAPAKFVSKINVPVFLACQFTDEQTGGHCPALVTRFTGTTRKWFTFTNGVHTDSLDPATFNRWYDFLSLYVAHRAPALSPAEKDAAPIVFNAVMGVPDVHLPDDPIQGRPSYADALAAFEALPPVRILFDNGAGGAPGAPFAGFEQSFAGWPSTQNRTWYLGSGGSLTDTPPTDDGGDGFSWNPAARPATDFSAGNTGPGGLWTASPSYQWTPAPGGTAVAYTSAPLAANTVVVGTGALKAWVKASVADVDLQATITEIRPDGKETFVQSGWLRASRRGGLRKSQVKPLPKGKFTPLTVPLYYQGHAYRAGSRIRVTISAPGGDQPEWSFGERVPAKGTADVTLAHSPTEPSALTLPVAPDVTVPTGLPPCPGLRGEPCRAVGT